MFDCSIAMGKNPEKSYLFGRVLRNYTGFAMALMGARGSLKLERNESEAQEKY